MRSDPRALLEPLNFSSSPPTQPVLRHLPPAVRPCGPDSALPRPSSAPPPGPAPALPPSRPRPSSAPFQARPSSARPPGPAPDRPRPSSAPFQAPPLLRPLQVQRSPSPKPLSLLGNPSPGVAGWGGVGGAGGVDGSVSPSGGPWTLSSLVGVSCGGRLGEGRGGEPSHPTHCIPKEQQSLLTSLGLQVSQFTVAPTLFGSGWSPYSAFKASGQP